MEPTPTAPKKPRRRRAKAKPAPAAVEVAPSVDPELAPLVDPEPDYSPEGRYEAEAAMLNDPEVTPLDPAPPMGGYAPGYDVSEGRTVPWGHGPGRSVSAPLWEHAAAMPDSEQIAVWLEIEGRPEYIGRIRARAGLDEFVLKFKGAMMRDGVPIGGEFICRPLDRAGRHAGQEFRKRVSAHHPMLRQGAALGDGAVVAPQASIPPLVEELLRQQRDEIAAMRAEAAAERDRIAAEREELASERVALAANAASGVQAVSERMMEADAARQRESLSTLTSIFASQMEMQRQASEERQREHERSLERERERALREQQARDAAWERERERERSRASEAESERDRRLERYKADQEAALQREREHAERMVGLMQREADGNGLGGVTKLLDTFGFTPSDALEAAKNLLTQQNGSSDGTLATVIKTAGEAWGKTMDAQGKAAEAAKAQAEAAEDLDYPPMLAGAVAPHLQGEPPPQPFAVPAPVAPVVAEAPVPSGPTPPPDMDLGTLRRVRKGVLALLGRLRGEPETEWVGVVTLGLTTTPEIVAYLRHVTVSGAMREAGADEQFIKRFIAVLNDSGLVPADIPR